MERIFMAVGWLAGALGVLLTLVAAGARLAGLFWLGGYASGTLMLGGIALMTMGCLGFLAALAVGRSPASR